jgi:hypothetical protein
LGNVDKVYGHLEYLADILDIFWPFGAFCVNLVHFSGFGIMHEEKSGNPDKELEQTKVSLKSSKTFFS